jgi:hypothetical protein
MRRSGLGLLGWLCIALACSAPAEAQNTVRARLLTELDAATFSQHFPAVALATGASGRVTLACNIAIDGSSVCETAVEAPADMGFGAAAVAMSRDWTFAPRQQDGQSVASVLRVNIVFENEVPTRQALAGTIFVDATSGSSLAPSVEGPTLTEEQRRLLPCSWRGSHCWPPWSTSSQSRDQTRDDENTQYYPSAARLAGIGGRAIIACAIRASRRPDCGIETEAPQGHEFGASAQRLVSDIAAQLDLEPGAVFRAPVHFEMHPATERARWPDVWERRPTGGDFLRHYPSAALSRGRDGRTLLICEIMADRRLNCVGGFEDPENEGFGPAGAAIARSFLLSEEYFGSPGYTVGERIRMPITFRFR